MCNDRSCFNCEYLHMGRCMNVRSKFFDDECDKVKICGAWREKNDDTDYRQKWGSLA